MASREKLDRCFIRITKEVADLSNAIRLKTGAVIVKDGNIISFGCNGTLPNDPNICEDWAEDRSGLGITKLTPELLDRYNRGEGVLITRPDTIHAEQNAFDKLVRDGGPSVAGATLYCTDSPCIVCATRIANAKIAEVVYYGEYRDPVGREKLLSRGIICRKFDEIH